MCIVFINFYKTEALSILFLCGIFADINLIRERAARDWETAIPFQQAFLHMGKDLRF